MDGLEQILRKIEAGDRLGEREFSLLERRAREEGAGERLRLALAHALLNADRAREALPLVETLVRHTPGSIDVLLAHARALALLERWGAAEDALKAVLLRRPDDPEALKAWALLRLRRGELAPARAVARQVLAQDPFDAEAQMIHGEMESDGAQGAQVELVEDRRGAFRAALFARLGQLGVRFRPQGDGVLVRTAAGRTLRVGFEAQASAADVRYRERAVQLADGLASMAHGMPDSREQLLAQVLPVLVTAQGADERAGALSVEGPAGLRLMAVVEHPELMLFVPQGLCEALGCEPQVLFAAARARLDAALSHAVRLPGLDARIHTWAEADGADTARLLSPRHLAALPETVGPGPWHVALMDAEHVMLCRADDAEARAELTSLVRRSPEGAELLVLGVDGSLTRPPLEPSA